MSLTAIIGGSGSSLATGFSALRREVVYTRFGEPSSPLVFGSVGDARVVLLPRHGYTHAIPPHEINYRANLTALKTVGAARIIAINTVGGIGDAFGPGEIVVPDQLVDYTHGRESTFTTTGALHHIEFAAPYDEDLRQILIAAAASAGVEVHSAGTMAVTQGPRLETVAEIDRLLRDGCDIVGMTGMPEPVLARELGIPFACFAPVINWAAGRSADGIHEQIRDHLAPAIDRVDRALISVLEALRAA